MMLICDHRSYPVNSLNNGECDHSSRSVGLGDLLKPANCEVFETKLERKLNY
jgi:hypothetical protein